MLNLDPDRIYSLNEVSEILHVSYRTLLRLLKSQQITAAKIGGQWRISGKDIQDYYDSRLQKANRV